MKDYNLHIFAKCPSIICVNGKNVGVIDKTKNLCIDLKVYSSSLVVSCQPILTENNICVPYSVQLKHDNFQLTSSCNYAKVVPFPNRNYYLILEENPINQSGIEKVFDNLVGKYNVVAVNENSCYISIYENTILKYSCTSETLEKVNVSVKNNVLCFKGYTKKHDYFLLLLNTKDYTPIYNSVCHKIEENDSNIKTLKFANDIAKHGIVTEIKLGATPDVNSYLVYANNDAVTISEPKLVPYAFLEAIKIGNLTLARRYLSSTLSGSASDAHLKHYFGNISEIHYNCFNNNANLLNYTIFNDSYHNFNFSVMNNKIEEIEEINI